jgi:hypothetical protein
VAFGLGAPLLLSGFGFEPKGKKGFMATSFQREEQEKVGF